MAKTIVKNKLAVWLEVRFKVEITKGLTDENWVVTLDNNRQYLKQESCLANIPSYCTQPPTQFTEKISTDGSRGQELIIIITITIIIITVHISVCIRVITGKYWSEIDITWWKYVLWCPYAVVTREIKLFQNYFSLRRCQAEIILFQRVETCLKLFQSYFRSLSQLINIFHTFNVAEIILK